MEEKNSNVSNVSSPLIRFYNRIPKKYIKHSASHIHNRKSPSRHTESSILQVRKRRPATRPLAAPTFNIFSDDAPVAPTSASDAKEASTIKTLRQPVRKVEAEVVGVSRRPAALRLLCFESFLTH